MRDEDLASGEDPILLAIDDDAIEARMQAMGAGSCCCVFSLVMWLAGAGGTVYLVRRAQEPAP